jgi:hypothetical protein
LDTLRRSADKPWRRVADTDLDNRSLARYGIEGLDEFEALHALVKALDGAFLAHPAKIEDK